MKINDIEGKHIIYFIIGIIAIMYMAHILMNSKNSKEINLEGYGQTRKRYVLYNFYSPSCGYSVQFMPSWERVKNMLSKNDNIEVKSIDSTMKENSEITFYYDISGYPTVILVTPSGNTIEYQGNRDPNDLYNFVIKNMID